MFYKIGVIKTFAKFTRKHLYQSLFFNKVAGLSLNNSWQILLYLAFQHNQRFYKVRWKDSWLLEEQLKEHCYEILKRFWRFPEHMGADPSQLPGFGKVGLSSNIYICLYLSTDKSAVLGE